MAQSVVNGTQTLGGPAEKPKTRAGLGIMLALWIGLAVSLLGDNFYRVGLTWHVTSHGGVAAATWLGVAMAIPMAVLGLFAGTLVDRWNRPATMIITDFVRLVVVGQFGLLFVLTQPPRIAVFVAAAVLAGSGACFNPAFQAWLPDLFEDRDKLMRFDALFLSTISGVGVVGPAVAGLLYPVIGVSGLLLLDAASFAASAIAVWYVTRHHVRPAVADEPDAPARQPRPTLLNGSVEGLKYIFGNPVLRPQFTIFPVLECANYALLFMLPVYLIATMHASSWLFGSLVAANAAGRVAGAWLVAHTRLARRRGWVLATNYLLQGAGLGAFCLTHSPVPAMLAFAVMGLPAGGSQIAISSWVQTGVDRRIRGRVFGALTTFVLWFMPFGPVIFGWLADSFGSRFALLMVAATFGVGGALIASSRAVRTLR